MKYLLLISGILGVVAAGCGREASTAPGPQSPTWTLLEFHSDGDGTSDSEVDVAVSSAAELTLRHGRGNVASSRGLLAGERLETLARLVDALPPHSYASPSPCAPGGYVVSLVRDGEERSYRTGACDPGAPESVAALAEYFRGIVDALLAPPARAVVTRTLLSGVSSAIGAPRREVVRDKDAWIRLLLEHSPDQVVAAPQVDFARQMVVAEFLGDRPSTGFEVESEGAEVTIGGLMRVRFGAREPGPGCITQRVVTQPFILVAVDQRPDAELFFETATVEVHCE